MDLSSNLEILGVSPVKAPGGTHTIYAIRCRSNGKTWTMYDRYSNIRRIYDVAKVGCLELFLTSHPASTLIPVPCSNTWLHLYVITHVSHCSHRSLIPTCRGLKEEKSISLLSMRYLGRRRICTAQKLFCCGCQLTLTFPPSRSFCARWKDVVAVEERSLHPRT